LSRFLSLRSKPLATLTRHKAPLARYHWQIVSMMQKKRLFSSRRPLPMTDWGGRNLDFD